MAETTHSRLRRMVCWAGILLTTCSLGRAKTIRVDDDGPADYVTIQAAIDASVDGDTVLVAPGTYTGNGNRDIDFKGKAITVRSEAGPATCIIDCQGSRNDHHRGFYFHNREGGESILDGFTITGGYTEGGGGGVLCSRSSPSIRNCIVVGNTAGGGGGITLSGSDAVISNCIIAGNQALFWSSASNDGGGLTCAGGHPVVRNCTIYGNRAGGAGGGVSTRDARGTLRLVNCIFVNNTGGGGTQVSSGGCTTIIGCPDVEIINCCIDGHPNTIFVEKWSDPHQLPETCISEDPLFVRPGYWDLSGTPENPWDDFWVDGDYHLKSQAGRWDPNSGTWVKDEVTSPCIDAGDPNTPIGEEPFPNGGRINIGAYGGTAEASKSVSGLSGKYGGGDGTAGDPYLIFTAEQFDAVGAEPADWDKHFKLVADIDVSGYPGQELGIIGIDGARPFSGVFDGDNHAVTGLGRENPPDSSSAPLFGYVTGTVRGVRLIDPNVGGRLVYYTGALVGDNHGVIADCYAEEVNVVGGGWYAGGLVGRNAAEGTVIDCNSTGMVRERCAGGLVGKNNGTIVSSRSAASAEGNGPIGGLVGSNVDGAIENCCSTGAATGDDLTGGLVGHNSGGTITGCYSAAVVFGNDGVGGLVGENAGGIIANCYSAADVTGDRLTAGLVGDSGGGAITNCYAIGPVVGRWPAGGLVNWRHDDDLVTGSFWDMETTGCEWSAAGTGKTTAAMQTVEMFLDAGWDFVGETTNGGDDIWKLPEGQGYPKLFWE